MLFRSETTKSKFPCHIISRTIALHTASGCTNLSQTLRPFAESPLPCRVLLPAPRVAVHRLQLFFLARLCDAVRRESLAIQAILPRQLLKPAVTPGTELQQEKSKFPCHNISRPMKANRLFYRLTREEREEEYHRVRQRIFGNNEKGEASVIGLCIPKLCAMQSCG